MKHFKNLYTPNIKNLHAVAVNTKFFEYYVSISALNLGDNPILYGTLCRTIKLIAD